MSEYGIIKNGVLYTVEFTEEESYKYLDYLPVDEIDYTKVKADKGYIVDIQPYINGGRISYRYVKIFDKQAVRAEMRALRKRISESDYQVTKCYEASLIGEELPYDIKTLHQGRQEIRDKINELEALL